MSERKNTLTETERAELARLSDEGADHETALALVKAQYDRLMYAVRKTYGLVDGDQIDLTTGQITRKR